MRIGYAAGLNIKGMLSEMLAPKWLRRLFFHWSGAEADTHDLGQWAGDAFDYIKKAEEHMNRQEALDKHEMMRCLYMIHEEEVFDPVLETWGHIFDDWQRYELIPAYPVAMVAHDVCHNESTYGPEDFTIFRMRDGTFITAHESGCSCYSNEQASIDFHPTLEAAEAKMSQWRREYKKERHDSC